MDREQFDSLTRVFHHGASRRGFLGAALAVLGLAPLAVAAADHNRGGNAKADDDANASAAAGKYKKKGGKKPKPCKAPRKKCGGKCISVQTDNRNCGRCGNVCAAGQQCQAGSCQCATALCGGICCAAGKSCIGGQCWTDSEEAAFTSLLNNHRQANGRAPLTLQNQLGVAAELHSQDQAKYQYSGHTGHDGSTPGQRITAAGYNWSWYGENVYYDSSNGSAQAAFTWWKNSSGHNANMLNTNFTQFGIGRAQGANGYWYWTTTFGAPA